MKSINIVYRLSLAGEGIAKNKRLKLQYEVLPINNSSNEMWNRLLASETVVEKSEIVKAIKIGNVNQLCYEYRISILDACFQSFFLNALK